MIELKGSEKQIAWAERIRQEFFGGLNAEIDTARLRSADGSMGPEWAAIVEKAADDILASVEKDTAGRSWIWIENRHKIVGYSHRVVALASKRRNS